LTDEISEEEHRIALKQARAIFAYSSDNITNQAYWLGYAQAFDDYSWFTDYLQSLEQVSKADILRVARQYLDPNHRITGIYRKPKAA
jgi:zinc protease